MTQKICKVNKDNMKWTKISDSESFTRWLIGVKGVKGAKDVKGAKYGVRGVKGAKNGVRCKGAKAILN